MKYFIFGQTDSQDVTESGLLFDTLIGTTDKPEIGLTYLSIDRKIKLDEKLIGGATVEASVLYNSRHKVLWAVVGTEGEHWLNHAE